jgi:hypothetical protein
MGKEMKAAGAELKTEFRWVTPEEVEPANQLVARE